MRKILLVGKNPEFSKTLCTYLSEYFSVEVTQGIEAAWRAVHSWTPDVIVIEDSYQSTSITDLFYRVRNDEQFRHTGLVVLHERRDGTFESELFEKGADAVLDLSIKPNALVLRLKALIQRIDGFQGLQESKISVGDIVIHPKSKRVEHNGRIVELTPTQYALLLALACQPNQVLTRQWMKQNVWKGRRVSPRSIDAQISKLKKLLPPLQDKIINIYGEGYLLVPPKQAA